MKYQERDGRGPSAWLDDFEDQEGFDHDNDTKLINWGAVGNILLAAACAWFCYTFFAKPAGNYVRAWLDGPPVAHSKDQSKLP